MLAAAVLLPAPAAAIQTLDAADHAELEAAISATGVSRVALADDRIRRVIRSPGGFDVEHDAASGDLYLRPPEGQGPDADPGTALPITLFLGTERGFTYRLTLTPDARPSAQVLIRNAAADSGGANQAARGRVARRPRRGAGPAGAGRGPPRDPVRLRRRRPPRRGVVSASIETWRGTRYVAHVLQAGRDIDAATLAERFGTGVAAVWVAAARDRVPRERTAVVVTEPARAGIAR